MKAVQLTDKKKIELVDIPEPVLQPGWGEIEVKALGICGSDVHAYGGKSPNVKYPVVLGHEIAGTVLRIDDNGDNPNDIRVGDRIILNPYLYCGECVPCSKGQTNCCDDLKCLGVQTDGAMSERFAHPLKLMVRIPDEIDWETAAVIEPTVIALHALNRLNLEKGQHVAIIGSGCIGMLAGIVAIKKGIVPIMVDVVDERLALARSFGMEHTVNAATADAAAYIRNVTGGKMSAGVLEVSGSAAGVRNALDYIMSTGTIVLTGWPNTEVSLPTQFITKRELQLVGARDGVDAEFKEVIKMILEDGLDIHQIISKIVTMEDIPAEVQDLDENPGNNLKVIALNDLK